MKVLVISDIHGNLAALETVLKDAQGRGYDEIWCLGDVVGYGPDPNACIERLAALEPQLTVRLAGNHDYAVLGKEINVEDFNPEAQKAVLWTRAQLTDETRAYLDTLPGQAVQRGPFMLVHGSPRDPVWEYVLSPRIARENFEEMPDFRCCLVGHTHVPTMFSYRVDRRDGQTFGRCLQHRLTPGPPDVTLAFDQATGLEVWVPSTPRARTVLRAADRVWKRGVLWLRGAGRTRVASLPLPRPSGAADAVAKR